MTFLASQDLTIKFPPHPLLQYTHLCICENLCALEKKGENKCVELQIA